jgi:hypothetical protein
MLVITLISAGTDGTLRGKITDTDGAPLPGGVVYIPELEIGTAADLDGNYILLNILVGSYDISFSMIGKEKKIISDVSISMDKTVWLNVSLAIETIEGEEVIVRAVKPLVEKGKTAKQVSIGQDQIEALPIRDITELYTLQSGVVKVKSRQQAIPDHEERGLEEIHVRGGRAGEIAYMIDGLYIRNPIFGGIGNGTRLNLFAVKEFDWQPGGFNAEYGDAMSAVSNLHTNSGGEKISYKFKYQTSGVGSAFGSKYDELRGYDDYLLGLGGKIPGINKLYFWVSGQYTNHQNYRVYGFDDNAYIEDDPFNQENADNLVQPWDDVAGFRGFGFDKTTDIFGKLSYNYTSKLRFNLSYWTVAAHRKSFNPRYMYWDVGQNELFRDSDRIAGEINHTLGPKSFYTIRISRFVQDQFQGVRWKDSDSDGYPDWFELRYGAGERGTSDLYNEHVVPYSMSEAGDSIRYTMRDENTGWYLGATPGEYNWEVAEPFTDLNQNGVRDEGEPFSDLSLPGYTNDQWDGPQMITKANKRDGEYWLSPDMYESYVPFEDSDNDLNQLSLDPYFYQYNQTQQSSGSTSPEYLQWLSSNYYFGWNEGRVFGGSDRFYGTSRAITNEVKIDFTSQLTNLWKLRTGIDYKSHKLNFDEVKNPWEGQQAFTQSFEERFFDTGADGIVQGDDGWEEPDEGEGNGKWDKGELFVDANGNSSWDNFREPEELSVYIQNTYEVPWMVINAGVRADLVNYNTQIWADTLGNASPNIPWYYQDSNQNGKRDPGEPASTTAGFAKQETMFTKADWFSKISPRLGFSHVITDKATFSFNYGVYYQTPIYQNIYLNTNRLDDPEELFEETDGVVGNATMNASRTQQYEFGFNIQVSRNWAFQLAGWVRDMDQLSTIKSYRSGVYTYQVFGNGDYGSAKGVDFTLENRGMLVNMMLQYTFSVAKANSEYDWAAIGAEARDAPSQEFLMPFDRTHDLTLSLYSRLPYGINAGITAFIQSGAPYTPSFVEGNNEVADTRNKYSKRNATYKNMNLSLSKYIKIAGYKVSMGLDVFNVLDITNSLDTYALTGKPNDPGELYTQNVGLPVNASNFVFNNGPLDTKHTLSGSFYDTPWRYDSPRQMNFFVRIDFN